MRTCFPAGLANHASQVERRRDTSGQWKVLAVFSLSESKVQTDDPRNSEGWGWLVTNIQSGSLAWRKGHAAGAHLVGLQGPWCLALASSIIWAHRHHHFQAFSSPSSVFLLAPLLPSYQAYHHSSPFCLAFKSFVVARRLSWMWRKKVMMRPWFVLWKQKGAFQKQLVKLRWSPCFYARKVVPRQRQSSAFSLRRSWLRKDLQTVRQQTRGKCSLMHLGPEHDVSCG